MRTYNEILNIFKDCQAEVLKDGAPIRKVNNFIIKEFSVNDFGLTSPTFLSDLDKGFDISITSLFLDERTSIVGLRSLIIHELLHTIPHGLNHRGEWFKWAKKLMKIHPEYSIVPKVTFEEIGIPDIVIQEVYYKGKAKYAVRCKKCGMIFFRTRNSNLIKYPEEYACICDGKLERYFF